MTKGLVCIMHTKYSVRFIMYAVHNIYIYMSIRIHVPTVDIALCPRVRQLKNTVYTTTVLLFAIWVAGDVDY